MRHLLLFLLLPTLMLGQQNPITVTASAPSPISASINYGGPQGQSEICYWVVAKYPIGNVPPPTGACIFTGAPVTSGNPAIVNWNAMQGAVGYDVLRTLTETLTSNCTNCLLISNTTQTTFTDIGGSLPSYNLSNVPSPVKQFMQLDNQNYATPEFIIFPYPIRVGQSLIFPDGSVQTTASGSGTITTVNGTSPIVSSQVGATATISCSTCLTGTPTANAIQVGNGTQALQSRLATEDTSGNISTPGSMTTGVGGGPGEITWGPLLFAGLPATAPGTANGSIVYCSDCTINSNPCTGSGTGAFAERVNNAWTCGAAVGTGTVTSFSAGTLSPLFTTSVATSTTTPALTFVLTNAAGGTLFGNNTSSSGAPSYVTAPVLGVDNTTAGTLQLANSAAAAHTILASGATTTNTIAGFATVPTTGHIVTCTSSGSTCTLTDGGAPSTGTVTSVATTAPITGGTFTTSGTIACATCVTSSSPGAGIAHFAGSTQAVTSSAIVAADITSGTITGTQLDTNLGYRDIPIVFDGGGSALSGTINRCRVVSEAGTINSYSAVADVSGNALVKILTVAYSSYTGPASASDISNGGEQMTGVVKLQDTTLSSWNTSLSAGTVVCAQLSSPATMTWLEVTVRLSAN